MAMTPEERAERDKQRKRERYANDPEYRARKLAANAARSQSNPDPEWQAAYHARRQANDPEYVARRLQASMAWNRKQRIIQKNYVAAQKDKPCVDCGEQYPPYCMEFDHVRGTKLFGLSKLGSRTMKQIREEIAKCEVRCVLCHRKRHYGDPASDTIQETP